MALYKLTKDGAILKPEDGLRIPADQRNRHYRAYLKWLDQGNVPDPADPDPPAPPTVDPVELVDAIEQATDFADMKQRVAAVKRSGR